MTVRNPFRRALAGGICLGLALTLAHPAQASRFNNIIVLGDSWVDDGVKSVHLKQGVEVWQINPALLDSASRPAGRFSNGPVMPEHLTSLLGLDPGNTLNYAIGGAASGSNFAPFRFPFEMVQRPERNWNDPNGQITLLLDQHGGKLDPNTLYFVSIGGNDFIEAPFLGWTANAETTKANIVDGLTRLSDAGARTFMVLNYNGPVGNNIETAVTEAYITAKKQLGIDIIYVDTASLSRYIEQNLELFGYDPVLASTPCISGRGVTAVNTCTPEQESQRISWDGVHPTSRTHEVFALAGLALAESPAVQAALADIGLMSMQGAQRQLADRLSNTSVNGNTSPVRIASAAAQSDVTSYKLESTDGTGEIFFLADRLFVDRAETALDPSIDGHATAETLGFRFAPGRTWSWGAAATLVQTSASLRDGSRSNADHVLLTLLAGWSPAVAFLDGRPQVDLAVSAGRANIWSKRNPGIAGAIAAGSTSAREYAASLSLGYEIGLSNVTLRPRAAIYGNRIELDGFTEAGAPAGFNLITQDQNANSLVGEIGLGAQTRISLGPVNLMPSAGLYWDREFASRGRNVTVAPSTLPDLTFSAPTGAGDRNYGYAEAGVEMNLFNRATLGLGYTHSFARDDWRTEGFRLSLSVPLG